MRLVSFSEYEAGVLALGGAPFGIVAIGAMPVGVIAVGILPVGLLSFACGAGLGLGCYTCGLGFGARVRAVGLAIGGDAAALGLQLGIASERPEPERPFRPTVDVDAALAADEPSWIECAVGPDGTLPGLPVPVEMSDAAARAATELAGHLAYAKLLVLRPPPPAEQGYRKSAKPEEPRVVCLDLEDATARRSAGALAWYWARMLFVAAIVLGVLGYVVPERIAITKMTRIVEAQWSARPAEVVGPPIADDARCVVTATMRSDGFQRLHADTLVRCGSHLLFQLELRDGCTVEQAEALDSHTYRLRCFVKRRPRSEDSDGDVTPERPGLDLDTTQTPGRVRVWAKGPPQLDVKLQVDSLSAPVVGAPLLTGGRTRLEVPD
ncbi:MAG: hypothetical protein JRI23_23000 [Deltaproteobacteria bacterium]|nr:hypothetical protein [Deltaproteobacteria bacterium]MBW2534840.1 hypothetical protein [Deltaproteobacteria bacterium]